MSVPKSQRNVAVTQFIKDVITVRKTAIAITSKFPASYNRKTTDLLLKLAQQAFEYSIKGNDIYLSKTTSESIYNLRQTYFVKAHAALKTLSTEITFCLSLVEDGTNFLGKKGKYLARFKDWTAQITVAMARVKGVIDSDKRRWKEWHS